MLLYNHFLLLIFTIILISSSPTCSSYDKQNHSVSKILRPSRLLRQDQKWVTVDSHGAKANRNDDSQAFMEAWKEACSSNGKGFVVPKNKVYHLKPITFSGPCHPNFIIKIFGTIKASPRRSDYDADRRHWIVFENLENFVVEGGGTINGNGKIWWKKSCKVDKSLPCIGAPTAITFKDCKNVNVRNILIKNSQQMHLIFQDSVNVRASHLKVIAPGHSPNTDGIHVTGSQNVHILDSHVRTGDDCVSIVSGSKNIVVRNIKCGPGHGISIGSLGKDGSEDKVSNILVDRAIMSNTTNGVRIKSWQGGLGYAENIRFQNIVMHNVTNPIIVDQNYCDRKEECPEQPLAVQIKNVVYKNIRGSSNSEVAINFDCSKTFPCQGILLQNVFLNHRSGETTASCSNVRLATRGMVSPHCT